MGLTPLALAHAVDNPKAFLMFSGPGRSIDIGLCGGVIWNTEIAMKTATIYAVGDTLRGNQVLRRWINGQRKFAAIIDGDNLIIKKTRSLLDYAQQGGGRSMTPEEVSTETHLARRR